MTLHRRTATTSPCCATCEPGIIVIAQGRKRVDLGQTTFIYGESRYLLTSVDLPIVSQIVEASEETPCLAMSLKLEMPMGARLRAIATSGDQSHRTVKAIAWIRTNYVKPIRVEDLAQIAGKGVSTPHHHFRMLTAMGPVQYQKQFRLQAARGRMVIDGLDTATAAFEVCYESASQFNREYSRFFGRPPIRNIRTLRSQDAPPLERTI